jgi:hypothetical protein
MMPVSAPDYLGDESGELSERHMLAETMVIKPIKAVAGELDELWIL